MKRTDHLLALAVSVLRSNHENPAALATLQAAYVIDSNRKPDSVSIGADDGDGETDFLSWFKKLRSESIGHVMLSAYLYNDERLPAHIRAAYAGPSDLVLELGTNAGPRRYVLQLFHSSRHGLTVAGFIQLLDAQPDPEVMWARAAELILESNRLNNKSIFPGAETRPYLLSREGRQVFQYLADNLIGELQIESIVTGNDFIIPESLQQQFIKYPSLDFFPASDQESVFLYSLRDVTAEELLALADAQGFGDLLVEQMNRMIIERADEELTVFAIGDWKKTLLSMDPELVHRYDSILCRSICTICEERKTKPEIPAELAGIFGPDEMGQKRGAARSKAPNNWQLRNAEDRWEYYQFTRMEGFPAATMPDLAECRSRFKFTVNETRDFAASINSSFEEAFGLSAFILATDLPAGKMDGQMVALILSKAGAAGFPEPALDNLRGACDLALHFSDSGWDTSRVKDLLAINLSDVFGGMGSWNDEYVEHDTETYQRLSGELYERMRNFLAAVLSA